ncbi:MAG: hypothetical protein IH623_26880 [Verrucomicrobia bacterium]|nr:hypothetical protein [Verrucomicrobiota bacterium]
MTKLAAALGCSLMAVNSSWAALTQIKVSSINGVNSITSSAYDDNAVITVGGIQAQSTWSGAWNATIISGATYSPEYDVGDTFLAFCTDIGNVMPNGTYSYEARGFNTGAFSPNPEVSGTPPDPNWANNLSGQRAAWLYNTKYTLATTAATRSALAIAIWESLYEGSGTFDVTAKSTIGRSFQATGSGLNAIVSGTTTVAQLANSWLEAGEEAGWSGYNLTWWAEQQSTGYGDVQSLVGLESAAVPEPTTILAGALLLLPFGLSTLRAWRRNR